jgi:hypothetical protein
VDSLRVLCFKGSSEAHAWEFFFMICRQWAAIISFSNCLFSVTVSKQGVPSWCGIFERNAYFCMTSK